MKDNSFNFSRLYKILSLTFWLSLAIAGCSDGTTSSNGSNKKTTTESYKEPVTETDSIELAKIQKAYQQGWTDKDLKRNKRMYNKSSKKAWFLNEIIEIDNDAIFVKDFETGKTRMVEITRFAVGSTHGYIGPMRPMSEFPMFFRVGDIVQIPVDIRDIPESKLNGKKSAQEYYDDNDILFDWWCASNVWNRNNVGNPYYIGHIVIIYNLDVCNKRKQEYQYLAVYAKRQADSARLNKLNQQMVNDFYQSR